MNDGIRQALITFIDFIYAVVFALIIQQSFDEIINKGYSHLLNELPHLLLLVVVFYFLAWDWVLGRILTLRNPYQSYSRFFLEILIATFAYGTASAATKGKPSFLIHFSAVLFLGGLWARRTERQVVYTRDLQELCMIQVLQFTGCGVILFFYLWWHFFVRKEINWGLGVIIFIGMWLFVLAYEMTVPRYKGVSAGPGVPFITRSYVRKIRRFLLD